MMVVAKFCGVSFPYSFLPIMIVSNGFTLMSPALADLSLKCMESTFQVSTILETLNTYMSL